MAEPVQKKPVRLTEEDIAEYDRRIGPGFEGIPAAAPPEDAEKAIEERRAANQAEMRFRYAGQSPLRDVGQQIAESAERAAEGDVYDGDPVMANIEARQAADPIVQGAREYAARPEPQAPQRGGGGGGIARQRIPLQSAVMFDREIADLKRQEAEMFQRIRSSDILDDRQKVEEVAKMRRDIRAKIADVNAKKSAFLDTYEGKTERMQELVHEKNQAGLEGQATDQRLVAEGQEDQASLYRQQQREAQTLQQSYQQKQQAIRNEVQQARENLVSGIQDWKKASAKAATENPLSTGQSILGGIGVVLASIATGISGKDYGVLPVLERTIERELKRQQQALDNKRKAVGDQQMVLGVMREKYADAEMAYQAARAALAQEFAQELKASSTTVLARRNREKYGQTLEAVDRYAEGATLDLETKAMELQAQKQARADAAAAAAAQARLEAQRRARDPLLSRGAVVSEAKDRDWQRYVPGYGFTADPTARAKAEEAIALQKRLDDNYAKMDVLLQQGLDPGSDRAATYQSLAVETQKIMAQAKGQGAIAEGEAERANLSLPVGDDALHPRAQARLRASRAEAENAIRRQNETIFRPGVIRQGYDKKGNPVWKTVEVPYAPEVQQRHEQEAIRRSQGSAGPSAPLDVGAPVAR